MFTFARGICSKFLCCKEKFSFCVLTFSEQNISSKFCSTSKFSKIVSVDWSFEFICWKYRISRQPRSEIKRLDLLVYSKEAKSYLACKYRILRQQGSEVKKLDPLVCSKEAKSYLADFGREWYFVLLENSDSIAYSWIIFLASVHFP